MVLLRHEAREHFMVPAGRFGPPGRPDRSGVDPTFVATPSAGERGPPQFVVPNGVECYLSRQHPRGHAREYGIRSSTGRPVDRASHTIRSRLFRQSDIARD